MSGIVKSIIFAVVFFLAMLFGQFMSSQMLGNEFHPNWILSLGLAIFVGIAIFVADRKKK